MTEAGGNAQAVQLLLSVGAIFLIGPVAARFAPRRAGEVPS